MAILKRANTIKDILAVENQLRIIREEIEATEGRLRYLDNRTSYSTINLTFYERTGRIIRSRTGFFSKLSKAFRMGWQGLLMFIVGLGYIWPILLVIIALIIIIRLISIRNRRRNK